MANVGISSSVYRPVRPWEESDPAGLSFGRVLTEFKFHGPFVGILLAIFGMIHFLK